MAKQGLAKSQASKDGKRAHAQSSAATKRIKIAAKGELCVCELCGQKSDETLGANPHNHYSGCENREGEKPLIC
eukprot:6492445-Amphidinium_carterae.3